MPGHVRVPLPKDSERRKLLFDRAGTGSSRRRRNLGLERAFPT
jgi:hypothetical protein